MNAPILFLRAGHPFGAVLTDVTLPAQLGFKLFDNRAKQTRSKRISNLSRQEPITSDLHFLPFELALCHESCPPTYLCAGSTVVSLNFSDDFIWFLSRKFAEKKCR
jgi:hypothetical protein